MKKGFTLVEVLVASLILVISITGFLLSFVVCKNIIRRNTHKLNATMIINQNFEEIQRRVYWPQVEAFIQPATGGSYLTVVKNIDEVIPHNYFLEFDASTVINPSELQEIRIVRARVSWDDEYVSNLSNNSVVMSMVTNEPY